MNSKRKIQAMYVKRNNETRSRIIVAGRKQLVFLIGLCVRARVRACGYLGTWACADNK
jgi:hypothetical protein